MRGYVIKMNKVYLILFFIVIIFISPNMTKAQEKKYIFYELKPNEKVNLVYERENEILYNVIKSEITENNVLFDIELKSCDSFLLTETTPQYKVEKNILFINYFICDFPEDIEVYVPYKKIENTLLVENKVLFNIDVKVKQKSTISFEENTEKTSLKDIDKIVINIGYIPKYDPSFFDINNSCNSYYKCFDYVLKNQKIKTIEFVKLNIKKNN